MIVSQETKEMFLYQAVDMTNVYMKEISRSENGLATDGAIALEKFYDKLVELWNKKTK